MIVFYSAENWQNARRDENSHLHLIKPITLYLDLNKFLYPDNINFPAYVFFFSTKSKFHHHFSWKISGKIPNINMRISDTRLFNILKHIQSISFPSLKDRATEQAELWATTFDADTTQTTLEAIENMNPMKVSLEGMDNENHDLESQFQEQLTQVEATFKILQVRFHMRSKILFLTMIL